MSDDDNPLVYEVIAWLEKAAHDSDCFDILRRFSDGLPTTCKAVGFDFSGAFCDRPIDIKFRIPVSELKKATGLSDDGLAIVKQFLGAIPDGEIRAELVSDDNFGESIILHQLHWVPRELRAEFQQKVRTISDLVKKLIALQEASEPKPSPPPPSTGGPC
ncbi:MAG TPA: hypothetical protein VG826_29625 [Pirellulales bacterium]|nr:hypothetical protein [Pirellulales bacterium]